MTDPFICPHCGAVSHHPKDKEEGYCARCHAFTVEITDRLDSLLVNGLNELRSKRVEETLMILREALAVAQQLPPTKTE